jgi:hypothetical protein
MGAVSSVRNSRTCHALVTGTHIILGEGGGWKMHTQFWLENLEGRDHSEDLGVDGLYQNGSYGYSVGRCGLDSSGSG